MPFALIPLLIATMSLPGASTPGSFDLRHPHRFSVLLSGSSELAGNAGRRLEGDADGSGVLQLTIAPGERRLCYDFAVARVATPLMAHIHRNVDQGTGPTVVTLFTGPGGRLEDCVMWTEKWLDAIVSDPADFYVSLATTEFPDGALRGQL